MKIAVMGGINYIGEFSKLFHQDVEIAFFLDNSEKYIGQTIEGKKIYSPYDFPQGIIDYIVIFMYRYEVVNQELMELGIRADRIINVSQPELKLSEYGFLFHIEAAERIRLQLKIDYLERKIRELDNRQSAFEENYIYEVTALLQTETTNLPKICSVEDTCKRIIEDRCSLSRYGDGEFEIILGHAKDIYQGNDENLSRRLREILISNLYGHMVALADDYGAMTKVLREENRFAIRRHMTEEKRKVYYALLDMNKQYYNAYISRPYVIYPHDEIEQTKKRFDALRRIWDKQDILFVEGDRTRMGVGNDLFDNARSIERIIAPNENAFCVYEGLYDASMKFGKDKLILIALGPTATVLAYDLAKEGYWALDVGHLDLEYEWFLKGKGYSYIPHKYNNEVLGDTYVLPIEDKSYTASIQAQIM